MKRRTIIKLACIFPIVKIEDVGAEPVAKNSFINNVNKIQYYAVFFSNKDESIGFYFSSNGIDWEGPINFYDGGNVLKGRDPSVFYCRGYWYIFTTGNETGVTDFIAYKTDDLKKEWKTYYVKLDGVKTVVSNKIPWDSGNIPTKYLWAPKLCPSRRGLNLLTCIELSFDPNFPNTDKLYFGVYISKVIDIESLKFSIPKRVDLIEESGEINKFSRIDPYVVYNKENDNYVMCVKKETYGVLDFFFSNQIEGPYKYVSSLNLRLNDPHASIEGGGIYFNGMEWVVIFDRYVEREGIQYVTTKDFINFSIPRQFPIKFSSLMRHGNVRVINSI